MERDLERQPEPASTPTADAPLPKQFMFAVWIVSRSMRFRRCRCTPNLRLLFLSVLGALGVIRVQPHCVDGIFPESSPQCDNFFFGTQNDAARVRADGAFSILGCASCFSIEGGCEWFDTAFATGYTEEIFFSRTVISCVWQLAPMATRHV